MAHNLSIRADGVTEHAYVGQVGWTGLGNQLPANATIEEWIKAASMDWSIQRAVVRYATDREQDSALWASMPDKVVLMRSDTKAPLGVVSEAYKPVQPRAVLEFFRDLASDNGFTLETAGVLFGGKRFWALANIGPDSYVRDAADRVKGRLLLCTSADGTLATEGRFVCERVVCNNTLEMARGETGGTTVKVSHRTRFSDRDMKQKLGAIGESSFERTMGDLRRLAHAKVTDLDMVRDTVNLFYPNTFDAETGELLAEPAKLEKMERSGPVRRVAEMATDGRGLIGADMAGVQGTAWGWLNAVTQYVDHEARAQSADNRMNNALLGKGADLKVKAFEVAMSHADGSQVFYAPEPAETAAPADEHVVMGAALLDSLLG